MLFYLIINLVGQTQAAVIHGQQETFDFQRRIELGFDNLDRIEKFADTFQCEIFTLNRDDYGNAFTVMRPNEGEQSIKM